MKRDFSVWILAVAALACLSGATWIGFKSHSRNKMNLELVLSFEKEMMFGYQKKMHLITKILKVAQIHDPHINGILIHVPNWKATNRTDIRDIEEINSHLDTWLSRHMPRLQQLKGESPFLSGLLTELQILEKDLAAPRARLLSKAP